MVKTRKMKVINIENEEIITAMTKTKNNNTKNNHNNNGENENKNW